jgi:negative regulator of flagellin synthesis FlgM
MLISFKQVQEALKVYNQKTQTRRIDDVKKAGSVMGSDKVTLSTEGREIQAIRQKIAESPEVREAKVAELREAIKTGTYNVSGEEIAEKMLSRNLLDNLF